MRKLNFSCFDTDLNEYGLAIVEDENGKITIYDDPSCSFETWTLTYEEISDDLYMCWRERMKQKRFSKEAFEFERDLGTRLDRLTHKILARSWKPDGYFDFKVFHPERIISAPFYQDRVVEEWLTEKFVKPTIEPKLHQSNVACRTDMGPPEAKERVLKILSDMYQKYGTDFYYLKYDIKAYYDNVSHERIREYFKGMPALGFILFMNIVDNWVQTDGYAYENNPDCKFGVPKGNLPSQWIGLTYLNEIDWYIAGREDNEGQVRYMDDGIVFFHLKSSCLDCKIQIENFLKEQNMGIMLHPKKTVYAPISVGFSFCGWRYTLNEKTGRVKCSVRNDRKKLTKKKLKKVSEDYYVGKLSSKDVQAKLNGTYAFLKQGDTKQLVRYLNYRFIYTHDENVFYSDRSYLFKKKKHVKEEHIDEN